MHLDEPCSQSAFASLVGTSKQAIQARVEKGELLEGQTTKAWLITYCRALRNAASGREESSIKRQLDEAKRREALAKAMTLELQLYKSQGQILEIEQVREAMEKWIALARSEFLNAIEKITHVFERAGVEVNRDDIDAISGASIRVISDFSVESEITD